MKKRMLSYIASITLLVVAPLSLADNLIQVYNQAVKSDPVYRKAQADWLTAREELPLAITGVGAPGTGLLPNITASGAIQKVYQETKFDGSPTVSGNAEDKNYIISLDQPIFNFATWQSISSAKYGVKAATATYWAASQSLIQRAAFAYIEVLRANTSLRLILAQKEQFLHQLITAQQKFKVGLIAITGVYDAQASYDGAIADEIKARNNLQNQIENLRAITGVAYHSLNALKAYIPLAMPKPDNIEKWVSIADRQNYIIQADINTMIASKINVRVAAAGMAPTLDGVASYGTSVNGSLPATVGAPTSPTPTITQGTVGLQLNFPVFRGGYDIVNTKQSRYKYLSASDQLEIDHRNVVNQTRQAFLGIDSGISQIRADRQTIISFRNQLAATRAGYVVGTRTMVDVLESVTSLTQAQQTYADDRYNYIESIFTLKQQAGTLSPEDIVRINGWLGKSVIFSLKQPKVPSRSKINQQVGPNTDLLEINKPEKTSPTSPENNPGQGSTTNGSSNSSGSGSKKGVMPMTNPTTPSGGNNSGKSDSSGGSVNSTKATLPQPRDESKLRSHHKSVKAKHHQKKVAAKKPQYHAVTAKKAGSNSAKKTTSQQSNVSKAKVAGPKTLPAPAPSSLNAKENAKPVVKHISTKLQTSQRYQQKTQQKVAKKTNSSSMDVGKYTIELYTSHDERLSQQFLEKYDFGGKAQLLYTRSHRRDWYRVIYGFYNTRAEAEKALSQLPEELIRKRPYIVYLPSVGKK